MGVDGQGLGLLIENRQVRKVVAFYVGENRLFTSQYLDGSLRVDFTPKALSRNGCGPAAPVSPASHRTGVGTPVAEGKQVWQFDGHKYVAKLAHRSIDEERVTNGRS